MFGVLVKAPVNGMARITNGYFADEGIDQQVHSCAHEQGKNCVNRLASGEEVQTDQASQNDNSNADISVEILLDIERVVAARDTVLHIVPLLQSAVDSKGHSRSATRASRSIPDS